MEEASHACSRILWLHSYDMSRKSKPRKIESRFMAAWGRGWELGCAGNRRLLGMEGMV